MQPKKWMSGRSNTYEEMAGRAADAVCLDRVNQGLLDGHLLNTAHVKAVHAIPPCALMSCDSCRESSLTVDLLLLILGVLDSNDVQAGLVGEDEAAGLLEERQKNYE